MRNILFVNQAQYGYHIDYVNYCKLLKVDYKIYFICWDYNLPKIFEEGVSIQYISRNGSLFRRNFRFLFETVKIVKKSIDSFVFIHYFKGVSLLKLLSKKDQSLHLDIRTGNVSKSRIKRLVLNNLIFVESLFFKNISVISEGLKNYLGLKSTSVIIPLGASKLRLKRTTMKKLSLLYVGTLTNRRIDLTLKGLRLFLDENPKAEIFYTIIGDGWRDEKLYLGNLIQSLRLQNFVSLEGYIQNDKLIEFFEKTNAGVSFVPMTSYFNFQPATKTFEYLLAGLPVIATNTYENKKVINNDNGILIDDSIESFANGLYSLYQNISKYDEEKVRSSVDNYEWTKIVKKINDEILTRC